jgi:predicted GIY-YIG superfamily endonuclease
MRHQFGNFALLTPEPFDDIGRKAQESNENSITPRSIKAEEVAEVSVPKKLKTKIRSNGIWIVYLLRCADGTLYTGITIDLTRRVEQHNAGTASRYTRSRLPVVLIYKEPQASRSLALKRELAIKALSRLEKESMIKAAALPRRRGKSK